jgi:signal transduction histidine kinase/ActR/RegA family two-component response regulator
MQHSRLIHKFLLVSGSAAAVVLLLGLILERQFEEPQPDVGMIRTLTWGFILLTIVLILVAAVVHVRMVADRIQRVLHGMEEIRKGRYPHLVVESKDEVAELVRGFNQTVEELRDRDDKLKSWAGHRENELVKLSQVLEEERERLEMVLASIGDGVIVLDSENKVIMANRRVSEIFGIPMEALHRADLAKLIEQVKHRLVAPEAVEQKVLDLQKDPSMVDEITLELDDTGGPAIRLYSAPVRGADGKVLGRIATSLDLGRERELDRLKSEFLSTISHELRTPLTSVKGALGLVRGGAVGSVSAEMKELLDIALTNTDRLIHVINDILDIFQLERGQARIRPVNMSLAQSVTRALRAVASLADLRKVQVETALPPSLPAVKADPKRVEQVLVNLLNNAVKFSHPEGVVTIRAAAEDGMVRVSVEDRGRGMNPEFLERLFGKFEHAQGSLMRESQGAGLGLAICRHIVTAHGGSIWAESAGEGRGATFHFTLPAADRQGALGLLGGQQAEARLAERRLILVIDDDEDVARVIGYVFETMGHRVITAHNGKEAIELASRHHPEMITLDLVMPVLDGYAVLRSLRAAEDTRKIPIICISMEADPGQAMAAGADYYLEKPVDIEKLREVADRALAHLDGGER